PPPAPTRFPYTTLFRSASEGLKPGKNHELVASISRAAIFFPAGGAGRTLLAVRGDLQPRRIDSAIGEIAFNDGGATLAQRQVVLDRKSTRLNSSHRTIS